MNEIADKVLKFWFEELKPKNWFEKDLSLDNKIKTEFGEIHRKASSCELYKIRSTPKGRLAEIIILDQFSRNIYRDSPLSFSSDPLALALAQEAIAIKADEQLSTVEKSFLYMPYMHSESLEIHEIALELFDCEGLESNLDFEKKHLDIIKRFGRYPHRNEILKRESTKEEIEFLKTPGSSF